MTRYLIVLFAFTYCTLTAQTIEKQYFKLDSIARKKELHIRSKGSDNILLLNIYGTENNPSALASVWTEGKAHFFEYTKIHPDGKITTHQKILKSSLFFKEVNRFIADTLSKPTANPIEQISHCKLNVRTKEQKYEDVFEGKTLGVESTYTSTEIYLFLDRLLNQYRLKK